MVRSMPRTLNQSSDGDPDSASEPEEVITFSDPGSDSQNERAERPRVVSEKDGATYFQLAQRDYTSGDEYGAESTTPLPSSWSARRSRAHASSARAAAVALSQQEEYAAAQFAAQQQHAAALAAQQQQQLLLLSVVLVVLQARVLQQATSAAVHASAPTDARAGFPIDPLRDNRFRNLDHIKSDLRSYYRNGQYDKDVWAVAKDCWRRIQALPPTAATAVVFDIDDTLLNNYDELLREDFGYVPKLFDEWVERADAPAIPGGKWLFDTLVSASFSVVLITGRKEHLRNATVTNLHKSITSQHFSYELYMRPDDGDLANASAAVYKSNERSRIENLGTPRKVIASIGDQESDVYGASTGISCKMPNYLYYIP